MKVYQDSENEIGITDDQNIILLKFYKCTDGYLVNYCDDIIHKYECGDNIKFTEVVNRDKL